MLKKLLAILFLILLTFGNGWAETSPCVQPCTVDGRTGGTISSAITVTGEIKNEVDSANALLIQEADGTDVFNIDTTGTNTGQGGEGTVKIDSTASLPGSWQNLLMLTRYNTGGNQTSSQIQRCTRGVKGSETVSVIDDECAGIYYWAYDGGNYDFISRMVGDVSSINQITIESNATVCENDAGDLRIVTVAAHGLIVNDRVQFAAGTGALCTGISASTNYFVTQKDTNYKVNISATRGGSNIAYTDTGTAFTSYRYAVGGRMWFGTNDTAGINRIVLLLDDSPNVHIGADIQTIGITGISGKGVLYFHNDATAPTVPADRVALYSVDESTGNAALIIKGENGAFLQIGGSYSTGQFVMSKAGGLKMLMKNTTNSITLNFEADNLAGYIQTLTAHPLYITANGATGGEIILPIDGGFDLEDSGAKPACDLAHRGVFFVDEGATLVKDDISVCAKDAADAYAWRTIY
ncbi:MAG: hypothetical protein A2W22_06285 [Candidatus Levybacteria bacterium RBG_16_35_11]|nr:MAG: hypothetical protein A2W22_06285 [Candidatus Levybacteria bacterium RBG_16_35_11]